MINVGKTYELREQVSPPNSIIATQNELIKNKSRYAAQHKESKIS